MKYLITLMILLVGCSSTPPKIQHPVAPKKEWKAPKRCKTIGSLRGQHAAVTVQKDCIKNGVTTVGVLILDTKNHKKATEEATQMMLHILGFKPRLSLLFMSKNAGKPLYIFLVTGES